MARGRKRAAETTSSEEESRSRSSRSTKRRRKNEHFDDISSSESITTSDMSEKSTEDSQREYPEPETVKAPGSSGKKTVTKKKNTKITEKKLTSGPLRDIKKDKPEVADAIKNLKVEDLKRKLKLNGQRPWGAKKDLVARLIDCYVNGTLPPCEGCRGAVVVKQADKPEIGYFCNYRPLGGDKCTFRSKIVKRGDWVIEDGETI
eukprot:TRINITY_DN12194_c0_g1_i1.p1 TRINITY_DN12194_c0_g1~~TRINITY_DN12194_c0_g1_i1.p1  ORF type:complete len:204 (-),score=61.24 TRINITY_DN12194_c0_g1_i1:86-697(-)